MCGFAGRVSTAFTPPGAQLEAMSRLIAHRGPDDASIWRDERAALAHRRLAIVDLGGGRQPVVGEQGRVVLVYNGEVYNHVSLRRELEAAGHTFVTRCDTEAILHAHEEWGPRAPSRLRGMFAYAAWDRRTATLTLARDHLGIKPLYYALLPSGDLLFASELKPLLVDEEVDRAIDEDALAAYLALRYVPAPATIVRGVRKLLPGCTLTWREGAIRIERWWQVPLRSERSAPTWAEAGGRLCLLLDEVVDQCRMSDVPLGALLSGGLDSTLVSAILARLARRDGAPPPRTYSVGYAGRETRGSDERSWGRAAAAALGTQHREIVIAGEDVADRAADIAAALDEPLGDPSCAPMWFVSRLAAGEVKVVLSGEGADELFAGYGIYGRLVSAARLRRRVPGLAAAARAAATMLPPGRLRRTAELLAEPAEARYRGVSRAFDDERRPWGSQGAIARLLEPARTHADRAPSLLRRLLVLDQQVWLPDDILLKSDRMSMAHSLELRPPLLDPILVEEIAGWPDEWLARGGAGKAILRHAAHGIVPRAVLDRPKMGFATPMAAWLRGALRPLATELLTDRGSLAAERGELALVRRLLAEHRAGLDRTAELWALASLELWRREVAGRVAALRGVPRSARESCDGHRLLRQ
jgi:asparagine synthase (glutamine-hydrolysing)